MKQSILILLISMTVCCQKESNKNKSTTSLNSNIASINAYLETHSYILVFSIGSDICELCNLKTIDRLKYLQNRNIQVCLETNTVNSNNYSSDFFQIENGIINHKAIVQTNKAFLCMIDKNFNPSQYFVPKNEKPKELEDYLNSILPILSEH